MAEMIATRVAYGRALARLGAQRGDVVVLDADLSKSTMTHEFAKAYPERFVQMGIAEQDMMGTAAGLAAAGKVAYASTFAMFAAGRAYDQVRNSICYSNLNVKICATHAGLTVGEDGGSHQCLEDIALMRVIPNMKVFVPSDAVLTEWLVRQVADVSGPVYVRLGRPAVPVIYHPEQRFELGKAVTLREGSDVAIVACGVMVARALDAADILAQQGINAGAGYVQHQANRCRSHRWCRRPLRSHRHGRGALSDRGARRRRGGGGDIGHLCAGGAGRGERQVRQVRQA